MGRKYRATHYQMALAFKNRFKLAELSDDSLLAGRRIIQVKLNSYDCRGAYRTVLYIARFAISLELKGRRQYFEQPLRRMYTGDTDWPSTRALKGTLNTASIRKV